MKKTEIVKLLEKYDKAYHTDGEPIVSDQEYDNLKEELQRLDPKNKYFQRVGADIPNSIKLPFYMGSLNKIRDSQKTISTWTKTFKGPYTIMEKLDGISALYDIEKNKMFTRGNGTSGSDISYILPYIKLPTLSNISSNTATFLRGELILPTSEWTPEMGSNPRNVVAGTVNAKILNKQILTKIMFITYQIVFPNTSIQNINLIPQHVKNIQVSNIDLQSLKKTLIEWKQNSLYEIDGIVVYQQGLFDPPIGSNPKYAFAFKSIDTHTSIQVTVSNVEWNISKDGLIKPRVLFEPTSLDGVKIAAATGFNARYIYDNKINVGSIIEVIRSGGVIPKIERIIKHSDNPSMPTTNWKWNTNNVEAVINDVATDEQNISKIAHFFKTLNIKDFGKSTIKKLYELKFDSIDRILSITDSDSQQLSPIGPKTTEKLIAAIKDIKTNTNIPLIMSASNLFHNGIAEKTFKLIVKEYPDIINKEITLDQLLSIKGIGAKTAEQFIQHLPSFIAFYKKHFTEKEQKNNNNNRTHPYFNNKNIVFTGIRDKDLETLIENSGGKVMSSVSSKTNLLIAKDINAASGSITKAKKLNIQILSYDHIQEILSNDT